MSIMFTKIAELIIAANDNGVSMLKSDLDKTMLRLSGWDKRIVVNNFITLCIQYSDNKPLFKVLSAYCLDMLKNEDIPTRIRVYNGIEFNQRLGYSQSRLREDDMTEFLIRLYPYSRVVVSHHLHFFSDEYKFFVEL